MDRDFIGGFIDEAFIDPIRSVLIVDDDYPTYNDILKAGHRSGTADPAASKKSWRNQSAQLAGLIEDFRRRLRPVLVDIHDGTNVTLESEIEAVTDLHQSDLLVLDYELDKKRQGDGTRAIEILRRLMSNDHFNLVIIYTVEKLDVVFDAVRWALVTPFNGKLSDQETERAKELIDQGENEIEGFENDISSTIGSAQYFHFRQNDSRYLGIVARGQQPYTSFKYQADRVDWNSNERRLVLRYLLNEVEAANGVTQRTSGRYGDLEWSRKPPFWIKSASVFVALSGKTANNDDLLLNLRDSLINWNPSPSRLFLAKIRTEIDRFGVAAQQPVIRNRHALAYWYYLLLTADSGNQRHQRIGQSLSRHADQLLERVLPRVEEFVSRLVEVDIGSGHPMEICRSHFSVDFQKDGDRTRAALEHNVFVCSEDPVGSHLSTGHLFSMSSKYWLCLSPACDMVPSQLSAWRIRSVGERLPFVGIKLHEIGTTEIPEDINSNRYLFVRIDGEIKGFCFNHPSPQGRDSVPHWHVLYAEKRGLFSGGEFRFVVSQIEMGKTKLVSKQLRAQVVGQIRYEYALNLVQKLGVSLTRVGLDFIDGIDGGT